MTAWTDTYCSPRECGAMHQYHPEKVTSPPPPTSVYCRCSLFEQLSIIDVTRYIHTYI
jgi:hypothetical protein